MGKKANSKGMLPNGRRKSDLFVMLFHAMIDHPDYIALSGSAVKLLIDVARQYNGHNNGDFTVAMSMMSNRGWHKQTLKRALTELLELDWLRITRMPKHKRQPVLYGLSWLPIDGCNGKLDVGVQQEPRRSLSASHVVAKTPTPLVPNRYHSALPLGSRLVQ